MQQLTLSQLNKLIQSTLEQHLDTSYWVVAEIGELRVNQKGHCYMEFVEKDGQKLMAKLRANLWAYDFYNLNSLFSSVTGQPLGSGMKVLAKVMVQFHEVYGLSLVVKDLDPNFTLGERARLKQKVIDRLTREGIVDKNTLLRLPMVPQKIAVISSKTAAGYGDFIHQLTENQQKYHFEVQLFEAVMQGEDGAESIAKAIKLMESSEHQFDLLALIRGGGSQVDLDCFDSYTLSAEIAKCSIPVITGIGHQRDDTVADLVANTRLKTPTAVAEFLINGMMAFEEQLDFQLGRIRELAAAQLQHQQTRLFGMLKNLDHGARMVINKNQHRLDLLNQKILSGVNSCLKDNQNRLLHCQEKLSNQSIKVLAGEHQKLQLFETRITMADPQNILKRGYSITYLNGKVISNDTVVMEDDELDTRLPERKITSKVIKVTNE